MAKGNIAFGMLKGRIGDVVFSRKRGIQQSRAYVQSPANPQTLSQRGQRVKFGTASAFYRSAVKNLFKFAFEYKLPGESDYNAYIRYNLPDMACNTKSAYSRGLPCINNWMLSNGTLRSADIYWVDYGRLDKRALLCMDSWPEWGEDKTIADISNALMSYYDLQDGDIVTVVSISASQSPYTNLATMMAEGAQTDHADLGAPDWDIKQFTIDSHSVLKISTLGIFDFQERADDGLFLKNAGRYTSPLAFGCAVIFSRPTRRGLKVSTARLLLNDKAQQCADLCKSEMWWRYCAQNFDSAISLENTPENILEGSVDAFTNDKLLESTNGYPIAPVVNAQMSNTDFVTGLRYTDMTFHPSMIYFLVGNTKAEYRETTQIKGRTTYLYYVDGTDYKIGLDAWDGYNMGVYFIAPNQSLRMLGAFKKAQ